MKIDLSKFGNILRKSTRIVGFVVGFGMVSLVLFVLGFFFLLDVITTEGKNRSNEKMVQLLDRNIEEYDSLYEDLVSLQERGLRRLGMDFTYPEVSELEEIENEEIEDIRIRLKKVDSIMGATMFGEGRVEF